VNERTKRIVDSDAFSPEQKAICAECARAQIEHAPAGDEGVCTGFVVRAGIPFDRAIEAADIVAIESAGVLVLKNRVGRLGRFTESEFKALRETHPTAKVLWA
jgi:hypothetical protein